MPSFSCTVEYCTPPGLRLDRYVAEHLKILSRSQINARNLEARLDEKIVKNSRLLRGGEHLELSWAEAECPFLIPENLPLDVLYEDNRVIVVNKAQGMVVHPGAGNRQGTLANALLYRKLNKGAGFFVNTDHTETAEYAEASAAVTESVGLRPGIVHRLDKDTSGVIIAAWDDEALAFLSDQFKERKVRKSYAALVLGCPSETIGRIEKRITRSRRDRKLFTVSDNEGRPSLTYYKVVRTWGAYSLLLLRPKTGRTHQIRVHLKHLGNPVLGDPLYGRSSPPGDPRFKNASLMLHAKRLSLVLPGHSNPVTFKAQFPPRFKVFF